MMSNVVVSGASSGIGYEVVLHLLAQGHRVVALARSADGLERLLSAAVQQNADVRLTILSFDIVHGDYQEALIPVVSKFLGTVDVLINNAGILLNKPFAETTIDDFSELFQGNVGGHVRLIQQMLPLMPRGAHVVNIGSMGGVQGSSKFSGLSAYSASKAALHVLTECLASELSPQDIKVNCLALGSAQTEMLEKAFPGYVSPVSAADMAKYVADFAVTGHRLFNGKILPVATATP